MSEMDVNVALRLPCGEPGQGNWLDEKVTMPLLLFFALPGDLRGLFRFVWSFFRPVNS